MKPNIIFVLSLLLILERQAAVMGQKGGSKGQLPSGSSQFPQRQKGQHYSGQKDKQHTESKGSFSIQHTYHVDANDHDRTRKSQQYYSDAQHKTTKSEQHLRGSKELLNYKLEGRDSAKSKGHFHVIVIHHKGGQVHHGTQNPSQDQGNSPSGKGISSQYSNTEERLRVRGLSKEQASASGAQKGRTQGGSQTNYVLQTEELVANKQQRETQNSHRNKGHYQNVVDVREEHSSKLQTSLRPAHQHKLQHGYKDIFTTQDELLVYNKNQHQTKNLNQDQEHGRKAHKIYQPSSTEERRLHYGENGVQKDVSQSSSYSQTEEKAQGKSQKQVTIPSQEQEHSQKANKISYQSSSTEERRLHYGENGVQKDVSQSSSYSQTEEKAHGKSQKQITIPSQEQEHSQKANKISYQSSSTEERRLHYGENGVQKDVSQSSICRQTEEKPRGKSQKQITIPSQEQEHSQKANKISYQSSSTEERRLHYGENGVQKDVSQSSIYRQTEEKAYGKSQKQVTIPSQEQEHSQKANKISYQSSSTEERRLHYGENGVQKDVSQSSSYSQTEEKAHGKSQKQVTIPSQEQEHSQKANKISYQSSSTEERRLHYGENGVQKDVSQSSSYSQTEEKAHGKSQKQITIPSQEQEHSQKANKISYQSSSTEERRLHYGENGVQKDVSQSSIYSQTENLIAGKSQIQAPNPKQQSRHGENANGESRQSTNREQDLLSHEQKVRHQHGSHGALDLVILEHEGDGNHHLVQRHNYDRNPLST
uniref:Semenogelin I isoform a preproprotein n=1 Tax=Papio anubis TaxID=9555 RepID=A4K2M8_PAPAN|nr:semenogelin-1 precursor [Papio anubis]ABO52911.1 semenogelin I isoform a preproprotein [Papio anubis]